MKRLNGSSIAETLRRAKYPVAARAVGGEMMIMSAKDSTLFTLNEVAMAIWEAADGRRRSMRSWIRKLRGF